MTVKLTPAALLLLGSLVLNGVLLGYLLASRNGPPIGGPEPFGQASFALREFIHAAPEDERAQIMRRLRNNETSVRRLHQEARQARQNVHDALSAEPFDPEAARSAMADMRRTRGAIDAKGHELLIDLIQTLPPEDRRRAIEAGFQRRHGPHGPMRGLPGPPPKFQR